NNTVAGSLTQALEFGDKWDHMLCLFGNYTDFRNPFITNYEERVESGSGLRTWLRYRSGTSLKPEFILGTEQQVLSAAINNSVNLRGNKGALPGGNNYLVYQGFVFSRVGIDVYNKVLLEASL